MTDTMAGGGRGGVGIRLFVSGGEVVKRTFDQVGDSGKKMWAEIALGQKAANPAIRALSLGAGEAKSGIDGLASRAGGASVALGAFGAAGVAVAAVLGGLVVAFGKTREAMAFADEIDDAAQKLAIGTTALQQYRYAMTAVGGSATDADTAIQSFTAKLGEAQAGGRALQWFQRIGFTREQLQGYDTAEEALGDVANKLAGLNKETERTAVSSKIGLGAMLPLIREGEAGMEALRQDALDLGYVMDEELVKKGADANQQFETMAHIVDVQLKSAFIGLSDEVLAFTQQIADALGSLNDFIARFGQWRERANLIYGEGAVDSFLRGNPGPLGRAAFDALRTGRAGDVQAAYDNPQYEDADDPAMQRQSHAVDQYYRRRGGGAGRLEDPPSPTGGRSTAAAAAAQAARDEERRVREATRARETLDREEMSARRERTRLMWAGDTPQERAQLAKGLLALDIQERDAKRAALRAELERTGAIDAATQINLDQLKLLDDESDALASRKILEDQQRDLAKERVEREQVAAEDAIALLNIQGQLARTGAERYDISRKILLAEQALERSVRDAAMRADGIVSEDEQKSWDSLLARQEGDRTVQFTLEQDRLNDQFRSAGREIVQAIEDGRIGDLIADRLKSRLLDMALDGLFDFMGGGKSKGGGVFNRALDFGLSLFSKGGGRAAGGDVRDGFAYGAAEHGPELFMLGGNGHVTSAAETARMVRDLGGPGEGGSRGGDVIVKATYAPNISVQGSGPEIDALRRELAAERAAFQSNVVAAVNDGISRRTIGR